MKPLILDSALGTELENRGEYLPSFKTSIWSAYSLINNPEVIKQIHIDNIEAGADVLVAGSFVFQSGNPVDTIAKLKSISNY